MAVTTVPPSARSASPCSATSGPPTSGPGGAAGSGGSSGGRCCDTGRPIFTDPISGQTVCSCQYDLISYQRLASAGIAGPGGVPLSMYSAPYSPETMAAYFPAIGADQAPFYANPAAAGIDLKENLAAGGAPWPYPSVYHPYDAAFGYPFNSCRPDPNQPNPFDQLTLCGIGGHFYEADVRCGRYCLFRTFILYGISRACECRSA
uniref:Uncharacterized protein n=1 Tax=Anopheles coluzzii TaxID=1518534 RepID=A0A8W7P2R6_ANOCL